jgi:hypothetical protein
MKLGNLSFLSLAAFSLIALISCSGSQDQSSDKYLTGDLRTEQLRIDLASQYRAVGDERTEPVESRRSLKNAQIQVLDTALLDVPSYQIPLSELNSELTINRMALGISGDRMMIADAKGKFFELRIDQEIASLRRLPFDIPTNITGLQNYFKRTNAFGINWVSFSDVVFISERIAIVSYSHWNEADECVTVRVERLDLKDDWSLADGESRKEIFRSEPCLQINGAVRNFAGHQPGGRMVKLDDTHILLTVGDFAKDPLIQDETTSYGKIFRVSTECCASEIVSMGHRNPQGLATDSDGNLWSSEHGPRGGDELNQIRFDRNYGWPLVSLGVDYTLKRYGNLPVAGKHEGFEEPIFAWVPSKGIGNIFFVQGFAPEWENDLLVSSLNGGILFRLRLIENRVQYEEPIFFGQRLRDGGQLKDGSIVLITDAGNLIVLPVPKYPDAYAFVVGLTGQMSPSAKGVIASCRECHALSPGVIDESAKLNLSNMYG